MPTTRQRRPTRLFRLCPCDSRNPRRGFCRSSRRLHPIRRHLLWSPRCRLFRRLPILPILLSLRCHPPRRCCQRSWERPRNRRKCTLPKTLCTRRRSRSSLDLNKSCLGRSPGRCTHRYRMYTCRRRHSRRIRAFFRRSRRRCTFRFGSTPDRRCPRRTKLRRRRLRRW